MRYVNFSLLLINILVTYMAIVTLLLQSFILIGFKIRAHTLSINQLNYFKI